MNYIELGGRFRLRYAYIDTDDHRADSLFRRYNIRVKIDSEYSKDKEIYRVILCRIRRRQKAVFEKAMNELVRNMHLYGHADYTGFCEDFLEFSRNES